MGVIHLMGVVHPERADVNVRQLTLHTGGDLRSQVHVAIESSQVRVTVVSEDAVDRTALKNSMQRFVAKIVDCLGLTLGCGYDVELIQLIEEGDHAQVVYGVGYPALRTRESPVSFEDLLRATQGEDGLYLERALRDFSDAIRRPYDSPFHCYRAIETLMQYFKFIGNLDDDKKGWEIMRATLHVERDTIMRIKELADPLRHGAGLKRLGSAERDEAMLLTRDVIANFAAYAKKKETEGSSP